MNRKASILVSRRDTVGEQEIRSKPRISFSPICHQETSNQRNNDNHESNLNRQTALTIKNFLDVKRPSYSTQKTEPDQLMNTILRMQKKMHERVTKNNYKYSQILNRIQGDFESIRQHCKFVKVEEGRTVNAYLNFKDGIDIADKRKRLNCLSLLNNFAASTNPVNRITFDEHQGNIKRKNSLSRACSPETIAKTGKPKFNFSRRTRMSLS